MNAFFVAVEFALTRLPSLEPTEDELASSPGLARAMSMLDRLEIHLTGCQLGISATSVLLGVLAEPAVTGLIEPMLGRVGLEGSTVTAFSVGVSVVLLNLAHKIWGEQAPTYLGVERPRQVAARLAPILYWWSKIMGPIIRLGDGAAKWTLGLFGVEITRSWAQDEVEGAGSESLESSDRAGDRVALRRKMTELLARESVPPDRRKEVLASLDIDEVPCRDVMVRTADMVALALDVPRRENLERIGRTGHTRYPVLVRDSTENGALGVEGVAGVIYVPGLFSPPERLTADCLQMDDLLEDPVTCEGDLPVADLIDQLQEAGQEVAVVRDGDRVVGFVTITDALEVITGDVQDPLDQV